MTEPQARHARVTGAAGGIGQALIRAFAGAGYSVIAIDLSPAPQYLPCARYLQLDLERTVQDEAQAAAAFARVDQCLQGAGLHALINNAALQILGGIDTLSRADWQHTLNVNLLAPFLWTQGLLPALERTGGQYQQHPRPPDQGRFCGLCDQQGGLERDDAGDGGRSARACQSQRHRASRHRHRDAEGGVCRFARARYARLEGWHPALRIGQPEEVAALALVLTRGELRFLRGPCIGLDGGISARLDAPD